MHTKFNASLPFSLAIALKKGWSLSGRGASGGQGANHFMTISYSQSLCKELSVYL